MFTPHCGGVTVTTMWKKALTPISVIVLLIGVGLIVFSTLGGDDSNGEPTSSEVSALDESVPPASIAGETSSPDGTGTPSESATTVVPATAGDASSSTSAGPGSTFFFPSFPTFVLPSSTLVIPSLPVPSLVVPSLPGLTVSPGVIGALTCNSFRNCAQKLYDAWKANTLLTATNFGTPGALATLNGISFSLISGTWPAAVTETSPTSFVATSNRLLPPTRVRFNFTAGQSGFKVQSVQFS